MSRFGIWALCILALSGCDDGRAGVDAAVNLDAAVAGDAALVDAAVVDAGPDDAGSSADAGAGDSGLPDSGLPDSGLPDSGLPDSGVPDSGAGDDAGSGMDAGSDAGFDAGSDAGFDAAVPARSDHHIHIEVDNFCNMAVSPMEVRIPSGQEAYFDWHNHSRDYAVDVWMSYGGGYTDLPTGATWDEPIRHCGTRFPHTEYADISTACSSHRFLIHCD